MPSRRIAVNLNSGTYYMTLTIQRWYYLFDRHNRWQILAESLRYCQEHKGLELNGYVFMLNHIHLIATSEAGRGMYRSGTGYVRSGTGFVPRPERLKSALGLKKLWCSGSARKTFRTEWSNGCP